MLKGNTAPEQLVTGFKYSFYYSANIVPQQFQHGWFYRQV